MVDVYENPHSYNDPINGTDSTVGGTQIRQDYYERRALVEAAKEAYFGQMANAKVMPKHMGKTMKLYHYMPILDDRNINDQGIDANGVSKASEFVANETVLKHVIQLIAPPDIGGDDYYVEGFGTGSTLAAAKTAADADATANVWAWAIQEEYVPASTADFTAAQTALTSAGWTVNLLAVSDDIYANYGNLYGSSKDVGAVARKLPSLDEHGGRVNRVGVTRRLIEGTMEKFGFFTEYTQESLDFDSDAEFKMHMTQEVVKAANEMTEDQLQIDLLNSAGLVRFAGEATSTATIGGSTAGGLTEDTVDYDDLVKLSLDLNDNRTPKQTTLIAGSRMIDTRVVNGGRYAYIGTELEPTLMRMKDYHNEKAWIPVAQYAQAGNVARGEVGAVHDFRFISVPEMMHFEAAGEVVSDESDEICSWSVNESGESRIDVFPLLVVGEGSFSTIGFQTDGQNSKFTIISKEPGREMADRHDPFGETGFYSIKWWYGFMLLRPERLALLKSAAVL